MQYISKKTWFGTIARSLIKIGEAWSKSITKKKETTAKSKNNYTGKQFSVLASFKMIVCKCGF